jgi:hypothetical protein
MTDLDKEARQERIRQRIREEIERISKSKYDGKAAARSNGKMPLGTQVNAVSLDDFYAFMPTHNYVFVPTRQMWVARSINSRIEPPVIGTNGPGADGKNKPKTISASAWLDRNRPVEQITWAPGLPMIVENRIISDGGWIEHSGLRCFNLYRAPTIIPGNGSAAGPCKGRAQHG